jgi:hypothetical protein
MSGEKVVQTDSRLTVFGYDTGVVSYLNNSHYRVRSYKAPTVSYVPPVVHKNSERKDTYSRLKTVSEKEFHNKYKNCTACGHDLSNEYEESVVLDYANAFCDTCADTAETFNMELTPLFKFN